MDGKSLSKMLNTLPDDNTPDKHDGAGGSDGEDQWQKADVEVVSSLFAGWVGSDARDVGNSCSSTKEIRAY